MLQAETARNRMMKVGLIHPAIDSKEIEPILGYVDEPELIDRDNLVLL